MYIHYYCKRVKSFQKHWLVLAIFKAFSWSESIPIRNVANSNFPKSLVKVYCTSLLAVTLWVLISSFVCILVELQYSLDTNEFTLLDSNIDRDQTQTYTRQDSSMIHSAKPTVQPVAITILAWKICFLLWDLQKWGLMVRRMDGRTKRAKIVVIPGRDCGSAEWINIHMQRFSLLIRKSILLSPYSHLRLNWIEFSFFYRDGQKYLDKT